jgi:hypothetical protein
MNSPPFVVNGPTRHITVGLGVLPIRESTDALMTVNRQEVLALPSCPNWWPTRWLTQPSS